MAKPPATTMCSSQKPVWIVAPATEQSSQGGRSSFTELGNLTGPSQYDIIPAGAPSVRHVSPWESPFPITDVSGRHRPSRFPNLVLQRNTRRVYVCCARLRSSPIRALQRSRPHRDGTEFRSQSRSICLDPVRNRRRIVSRFFHSTVSHCSPPLQLRRNGAIRAKHRHCGE